MMQPQRIKGNKGTGKVYHFSEYKNKKPFFLKPIKITVGNPVNDTFYMVKNLVYLDKQILVLKNERDPSHFILVEGKIEDGQLKTISMLPSDLMGDLSGLLKESI